MIMVTIFSQFIPVKLKKISASILGKVKKIEAYAKKWFSYYKKANFYSCPGIWERFFPWSVFQGVLKVILWYFQLKFELKSNRRFLLLHQCKTGLFASSLLTSLICIISVNPTYAKD